VISYDLFDILYATFIGLLSEDNTVKTGQNVLYLPFSTCHIKTLLHTTHFVLLSQYRLVIKAL